MTKLGTLSDPRITFNPELNPFPKAFPIAEHLNPFIEDGVDIFPILLHWASMPNMKAFMVRHMIEFALKANQLKGVHTLVEATSGNSGLSLGIVAPYYGIRRVVAVVERDIAPGKRAQLEFAGIDVVHPQDSLTTIETATKLGLQQGWCNLNQYSHAANWEAHFAYTGPHVWQQTQGKISVFAAALGTTGTAIGVSRFLRRKQSAARVVGGVCAPENPVPGVRTLVRLGEVLHNWRPHVHEVIQVRRRPAYKASLELCQAGNFMGPSSGLARVALYEFIARKKKAGRLDNLRNSEGRIVAAFICGDTALPYLDKYSTILDGVDFNLPQICL